MKAEHLFPAKTQSSVSNAIERPNELELLIECIFVEIDEMVLSMERNNRANLFDGLGRMLDESWE